MTFLTKKERDDFFEQLQMIGKYEAEVSIPRDEQVTDWFGDYAMYELRFGTNKEAFNRQYEKAVQYFKEKEAEHERG